MLHDPANYSEPHEFKPERFLNSDGTLNSDILEPSTMIFGFGRRICPGQYLASNMLFLTMASVLHVFNITPTLGEDGKPKVPELHMSPTIVSHPEPFDCSIQLRSSSREVLISA
ncbi:hypothetical protein QCA50_007647 [Cerrena zonata]|uniref:Cytochrome P450 n=1 Tax=Cerrena zonata TaxID=2478898 RepID=A0AAW0G6F9_9APHY